MAKHSTALTLNQLAIAIKNLLSKKGNFGINSMSNYRVYGSEYVCRFFANCQIFAACNRITIVGKVF